ncbi:MAG TPA: hypothetical protein ENG40_00355 [Thermoprotei archaeon]|nr:hypothetical protein [Thermoprotei archaeon]
MYSKAILILIALILLGLGVIFLIAAARNISRLFVAIPLIALGGGIILYSMKPTPQIYKVTVQWEPGGKVLAQELKCPRCGATLPPPDPTKSMDIIKCPYCGATIKLEEQPIW